MPRIASRDVHLRYVSLASDDVVQNMPVFRVLTGIFWVLLGGLVLLGRLKKRVCDNQFMFSAHFQ